MKSNLFTAVFSSVVLVGFVVVPSVAAPLRDASNSVYIYNLTPGSSHDFTVSGTPPVSRKIKANHCGVAKAVPTPDYATATMVSLGSLQSTISSLPVASPGACKKDKDSGIYNLTNAPAASRFRSSEGIIYFQGLSAASEYTITYPGLLKVRKATANACGYIKIISKEKSPITATSIIKFNNVLEFTVGRLSVVFPPKCKKISDTQSMMVISISDKALWAISN